MLLFTNPEKTNFFTLRVLGAFFTYLGFLGLMVFPSESAQAQFVIALDDQLDEYWVSEKKVAPVYPRIALKRGKMGCVAVGYIVQSDGMTSDHKVLAFYPSDVFDKSAIKAAKQFEYSAAVENPDRTPALTLNVFTYHMSGDGGRDDGDGEDKRKLLHEMCSEAGKKVLEPAPVDAGARSGTEVQD